MRMQNGSQCTAIEQEEMIRRYADTVYRLAYSYVRNRADADDLFQEVFLRYLRARPVFRDPEHARAWFIRVTINRARSFFHSAWHRHTEPLTEWAGEVTMEERALDEALNRLNKQDRLVIHLHYYEGYSTEEIAELTGKRPSSVRSQLTRARGRLREFLKEDE